MVSIIVPVYNAGDYIDTTIEMVKAQTYTDWELILVDDHSTDKSVDTIKACIEKDHESSHKIRLIQKQTNEGAAKARNTGVDNAKGRYIAFLDADDVWYKDKLERQMAFMRKHESAFTFTGYEFGDSRAVPNGRAVHVPPRLTYKKALSRTVIFTSTVILDTEKISKDLIYMPTIGSEDTATWWQILKSGVTACGLDEPLVIYRRPAKSLSSNKGVAIGRIWNLYRNVAGMPPLKSAVYMARWAWRATIRRVVADTIRNHVEAIKRFFTIELALIGLVLQTLLYAWVWFNRYYPLVNSYRVSQEGIEFGTGLKFYFWGHILVLAIYFALLFFFTKQNGGMETGYLKPGTIFTSQTAALSIANIIMYFQMSLMRNWLMPIRYMLWLTIVQTGFAGVWSLISDHIYRVVFPPVETLVIGGANTTPLVETFNTRQDRFRIMKVLHIGKNSVEEIKEECLHWYGAVVAGDMEENDRNEIMEYCYSHHIRVYYLPKVTDILIQGSKTTEMFALPIMELREYSISWENRILKRILDIAVSTPLIILSLPILIVRAVYGKAKYKKVIDSAICYTKSKKIFTLHTFYTDGEKKNWTDKLPALWSVFKGDMSMVGPRAIETKETDMRENKDPRFAYRLRVKAGITGNAQVYGEYTSDKGELLKLDIIYIQNYSIMLDFKLLVLSLRKLGRVQEKRKGRWLD